MATAWISEEDQDHETRREVKRGKRKRTYLSRKRQKKARALSITRFTRREEIEREREIRAFCSLVNEWSYG